jgi:hypothetical protein
MSKQQLNVVSAADVCGSVQGRGAILSSHVWLCPCCEQQPDDVSTAGYQLSCHKQWSGSYIISGVYSSTNCQQLLHSICAPCCDSTVQWRQKKGISHTSWRMGSQQQCQACTAAAVCCCVQGRTAHGILC